MDAAVKQMVGHYIGGRAVAGTSGRFGDVYNPATGAVTKSVALASASEVDAAVANAAEAFPAWAEIPPARRVQVLYRYRELLIQHMDEMARLLSSEHGKTVDDAKGSITRGLEVVEFACGIPQMLKGEFSEGVASGVDSWSMRQPLGVVAGITPFNFPAMVPMWMFPVAIACGNTFVLKPSERNPSCAGFMAQLLTDAGLPDGVVNVVNGDKEAVDTLLAHPTIQAVSFVGSTTVGEYIYKTGCAHGKRVQALCGAKNHMVVMPDADMGQVVDAVMGAAYGSAGERCMAISVVVAVGDDTADRMMEHLVPRIETLKVGAFDQEGVEMGPVITPDARDRIKGYIDRGVEEGAELVVDGRDISIPGYESGCFVGATVFDKVTPQMSVYTDEIFGPVLSVVRAKNYEEALQLVNDHEYGNGTAIFTRDGDTARDYGHRARIGMVGVNVPIPVPLAFHSFGGWKRSLFGPLNMHGQDGVRFYTKMKTITQRWPSDMPNVAEFSMPTLK